MSKNATPAGTAEPPRPPLYVTRPTMPEFADILPFLEKIWLTRVLTNYGPLHEQLEAALAAYLGVEHFSLVSNATLGCLMVLRHLAAGGGEVVTTPFSFVATTHTIRLSGAEPVFADIDGTTLNLDPAAAERLITPRTRAIMAVHSYGVPCDLDGLEAVAARHGLPLIYDAAHAMGARSGARSLASFGDHAVLSFHATKVFSTIEGGGIVSKTREAKQALDRLANHGIVDETSITTVGLNAKMSEVNAAFGLALLPRLDGHIAARGVAVGRYWEGLRDVAGLRCVCPPDRPGQNFYAFPILLGPGYPLSRDALYEKLRARGIFARRYFSPLISDLPMYRDLPSAGRARLPVASAAADRVLCLPLFPDIAEADQQRVIDAIRAP